MEEGNAGWTVIAKVAFDAYNVQAGGKTWDGKDIPPFEEVGEKVQANWVAAVQAVCAHVGRANAGEDTSAGTDSGSEAAA